jgi:uncharacterized protein (TIGR04255 family)
MVGMTTERHYSKSPITEAIIDFQVELPEGVSMPDLERCQDAAYPLKTHLRNVLGRLEVESEVTTSATSEQIGFLFTGADEKQLFQVRTTGFTMHRLEPYEGWGPFRDETRRLWGIYRQVTHPRTVARLAVRYIYRLDLLSPVSDLKEYLRTSPEVSPDLPQGLAGFFMELNIPQEDIKSTLLLRERFVPPTPPGAASVVLDIDLFRSDEVPIDEERIWNLVEILHTRNNEVFEACITARFRELIR